VERAGLSYLMLRGQAVFSVNTPVDIQVVLQSQLGRVAR